MNCLNDIVALSESLSITAIIADIPTTKNPLRCGTPSFDCAAALFARCKFKAGDNLMTKRGRSQRFFLLKS